MMTHPLMLSVPTLREYDVYHDAEQYTQGWNDAMKFIFAQEFKEEEKAKLKELLKGEQT